MICSLEFFLLADTFLVNVVVECADKFFGKSEARPMFYRILKHFFESGGLDDADMVVDLVHADGAGGGHPFAEKVDDLAIEGVDLCAVIGEGVFGVGGLGFRLAEGRGCDDDKDN